MRERGHDDGGGEYARQLFHVSRHQAVTEHQGNDGAASREPVGFFIRKLSDASELSLRLLSDLHATVARDVRQYRF